MPPSEARQQVDAFAATTPLDDLPGVLLVCNWRRTQGQVSEAWDHLIAAEPQLIADSPAEKAALGLMKVQLLLGLGRIGRSVIRKDDPCIRGMIAKVTHLVAVEKVEG